MGRNGNLELPAEHLNSVHFSHLLLTSASLRSNPHSKQNTAAPSRSRACRLESLNSPEALAASRKSQTNWAASSDHTGLADANLSKRAGRSVGKPASNFLAKCEVKGCLSYRQVLGYIPKALRANALAY